MHLETQWLLVHPQSVSRRQCGYSADYKWYRLEICDSQQAKSHLHGDVLIIGEIFQIKQKRFYSPKRGPQREMSEKYVLVLGSKQKKEKRFS